MQLASIEIVGQIDKILVKINIYQTQSKNASDFSSISRQKIYALTMDDNVIYTNKKACTLRKNADLKRLAYHMQTKVMRHKYSVYKPTSIMQYKQ